MALTGIGDSGVGTASDWKATSPRCREDFSPKVSFQCRLSYGVREPPCALVCINICAHVTNAKHWQPHHCLDTGCCSVTQVRRPDFPTKDNEVCLFVFLIKRVQIMEEYFITIKIPNPVGLRVQTQPRRIQTGAEKVQTEPKSTNWTPKSTNWTTEGTNWTVENTNWTILSTNWAIENTNWTIESTNWIIKNTNWTIESTNWIIKK